MVVVDYAEGVLLGTRRAMKHALTQRIPLGGGAQARPEPPHHRAAPADCHYKTSVVVDPLIHRAWILGPLSEFYLAHSVPNKVDLFDAEDCAASCNQNLSWQSFFDGNKLVNVAESLLGGSSSDA